MDFKYFKGPNDEMSDLVKDKTICSICGKLDNCFILDYTAVSPFNSDEKEGKVGCYSCLQEGRFEFWHDTEYGMIDENGVTKVYKHNIDNPPVIASSRLIEFRRTPQFISWQQEFWLCHCDDFMIYKGTWEPSDFYKNSKDGDGRGLFMQMTDKELNHLWDDSLPEGETVLKEWYSTYYVFECAHCGQLRGNWDCD